MKAASQDKDQLPGKLFVVEGIDGSGKSTQLDLLKKYLISEGFCVYYSEWNSSPLVRETTKRGKEEHSLTPLSFSLIHAADFADRFERTLLPPLKAGAVVLADRYVYTAYARDAARGVNRPYLRSLYRFAVQPTMAFYFRVPLEEALRRILTGRPQLKWYEAGMDLGLSDDPLTSFRLFQGRIVDEYEEMIPEFGLQVIDATRSLVKQQALVRNLVGPHLKGAIKAPSDEWREILREYKVRGRYLDRSWIENNH